MIAPFRVILLAFVVFIRFDVAVYSVAISFFSDFVLLWSFLLLLLAYYNTFSLDFFRSFFGHFQIGGGFVDFILIFLLLPLRLPLTGFKLGVISLSFLLVLGFGGEHSQELSNGFLAPASFFFTPLQSLPLLLSAVFARSRSAVVVISLSIFLRLRSHFLKFILVFLVVVVVAFESYDRYIYLSNFYPSSYFWDLLFTNRLSQWNLINFPSYPLGIDGAVSFINTVKFHNAFVDFRVASGCWFFPVFWLFLVLSYLTIAPVSVVLSFVFVQFFWYNSTVVLFGWFFLINYYQSLFLSKMTSYSDEFFPPES